MTKIDITRTELVWPGKYDDDGDVVTPRRVNLPFQVIERVNQTWASRTQREEDLEGHVATLFDYWQAEEQEMADPDDAWRNKLIWGDNLYVMESLLEHFAGKIDLIYIDPPFATGTDFSVTARLGSRTEIAKRQSLVEEKAYRDYSQAENRVKFWWRPFIARMAATTTAICRSVVRVTYDATQATNAIMLNVGSL